MQKSKQESLSEFFKDQDNITDRYYWSVGYDEGYEAASEEIKLLRADECICGEINARHCPVHESAEISQLKAKLANRHIIGKAYEISKESINKLAGELDEAKAIIQRQAELISYLIKDKDLAEINEHFNGHIKPL